MPAPWTGTPVANHAQAPLPGTAGLHSDASKDAPLTPNVSGEWGHTSITALWVPTLAAAHAFAGFWLWKAWRKSMPAKPHRASSGSSGSSGSSTWCKLRIARKSTKGFADIQADSEGSAVAASDAATDPEAQVPPPLVGGGSSGLIVDITDEEQALKALELIAAAATAPGGKAPPAPGAGPPATLEWRGVGCSYKTSAGPREVLADVWGTAVGGELQALLGPSGAGKSTLLDILAARKTTGSLTGKLLVNGELVGRRFVRKTAYVPQEDNFVPTMTAWETLEFYAEIVLSDGHTAQQRRDRIESVLSEVGLSHAKHTIVGGLLPGGLMLRGLSGGERKRLSVAAGMLAAPVFMFLDEPTSGLDSFAALTVMGYLKRLVRERGSVAICSIHQPRLAIWQMFDTVSLLANGRLMYQGPRDEMTEWFGSQGYNYDPSIHGVPSDWALDLVAIGFPKPARFYGSSITNWDQLLAASQAFKTRYLETRDTAAAAAAAATTQPEAAEVSAPAEAAGDVPLVRKGDKKAAKKAQQVASYPASAWRQFRTLLWREYLVITRNPFDVAGRTVTFAYVGVIMGALAYGLGSDAANLGRRLTVLHMSLCFYLLMPYISMGLYAADKKFVLADASSQLYRPIAYYVAKIAAITPFHVISALAYSFVIYGMAGLRPGAAHIFKNGLVNTLTHLMASQVLHAAAVVSPNTDMAFMISITWTSVQMLLSGFFIDFKGVFLYWVTYFRYLSIVYYGFQAAVANEFEGVLLPCTGTGLARPGQNIGTWIGFAMPNTSNAQRKTIASFFERSKGGVCVFDPSSTFEQYEINRPYWVNVGILLMYLLAMHLLTFAAILFSARRERR